MYLDLSFLCEMRKVIFRHIHHVQSNVLKKLISVYPSGLLQRTELQLQVWLWWFQSSDDNASVVGPPGVLTVEVELI